EAFAPEYGDANLGVDSTARLRYGLWLARETGLPVAFSGGVGHAAVDGPAEAEIAARIAARDFGRPLRWAESGSRDTRENAEHSVALLRRSGVNRIVLVTHGWHMARSAQAFEQAALRQGVGLAIVPAPMGLGEGDLRGVLHWLPSLAGYRLTTVVLREWLGRLAGA
ncbi:MAG: YdcF family protein, partial [Burkholderiales bacterium]|nr:YdcF family protein [Burkholderiales bacterium]